MEQKPNIFTEYELTAEEQLIAQSLSGLTVAFIQNLRADTAQQILNLTFDPNDPTEFLKQKVYKDGMLAAFSYLLDCAEAVVFKPTENPAEE